MKESIICSVCIFCITTLSWARQIENPDDFAFCTEIIYFTTDNEWIFKNLCEYHDGDRIPGTKSIKAISRETGLWVIKHWVKDPMYMKKRAVTLLDKEVLPTQNKLIASINKWKKVIGIAYEEYNRRGMDIKPIEDVLSFQAQLKKSRNWRKLYERDKGMRNLAKKEIEQETEKLLKMIDELFIPINAKIQNEYAAWAQQNPETAQQIALKRKISELEQRAAAAEAAAVMANFNASMARNQAAAAEQRAAWAESAAQDAQRSADDANRRAKDDELKLEVNGIW